jgi:hypothetical protein
VTARRRPAAAYNVDVTGAHRGKADPPGVIAGSAIRIAAFLAALAVVPALFFYGVVVGPELLQWSLVWLLQATVIVVFFRQRPPDRRLVLWTQVLAAGPTTWHIIDILAGRPHAVASVISIISVVALAGIIVIAGYAIRTGQLGWPWWPAPRKPAAPE